MTGQDDLWRALEREADELMQNIKYGRTISALAEEIAALPPNDPSASKFAEIVLTNVNDRELGTVWKIWKGAGRSDLRLRAEQEQERRLKRRRPRDWVSN